MPERRNRRLPPSSMCFMYGDRVPTDVRLAAAAAYLDVHKDPQWRDQIQVARIGLNAAMRQHGTRVCCMLVDDMPAYYCVFDEGRSLRAIWRSVLSTVLRRCVRGCAMELLRWAVLRFEWGNDVEIELSARESLVKMFQRNRVPLTGRELTPPSAYKRTQGAAYRMAFRVGDVLALPDTR
jgi:hypothetical protein